MFRWILVFAATFAHAQSAHDAISSFDPSPTAVDTSFCPNTNLQELSSQYDSFFKELLKLVPLNTPKTQKQFQNALKLAFKKQGEAPSSTALVGILFLAENHMKAMQARSSSPAYVGYSSYGSYGGFGGGSSVSFGIPLNDSLWTCQTLLVLSGGLQNITLEYVLNELERDYLDPHLEQVFELQKKHFPSDPLFPPFTEVRARAKAIHLTMAELAAIRGYTGSDFVLINRALRGEESYPPLEELTPYIELIKSGLKKIPPYEGLVVRGAQLPDNIRAQHEPGKVVTYPAFTSTSRGHTKFGGDGFQIQSKTGRDIDAFSACKGEEEVLFLPGTKFKVLSSEKRSEGEKYYDYVMMEVP